MKPRAVIAVAVALAAFLGLAACSSDDDDDDTTEPATGAPSTTAESATTTTTIPALRAADLCGAGAPVQIGTLPEPELLELSGVEATANEDGSLTLLAHNDSGDTARLFSFTPDAAGTTIDVENASAFDWEDMTESADAVYMGDIGDNFKIRPNIVVYRLAKPFATPLSAEPLELTYPDGAHDAEALMVDEPAGELVVVTKEAGGNSGVYTRPVETAGELELVATLDLGAGQLVTAGDISPTGDLIVLRTYASVLVWDRPAGESLADAFAAEPCPAPAPQDAQGEAISLLPDGYVTISEGADAPIWRVTAAAAG